MLKKFFTSILFMAFSFAGFSQLSGILREGFEGTTFPPAGWTTQNVLGTAVWARSTAKAYEGSASAYMIYQQTGGQDWLITPQFTVAATDSLIFYMSLAFRPYPPDSLAIKISTTTNAVASFTTTLLKLEEGVNYPASTTTWTRYAIPLSAYAGQNVYLAFKHANTDGDGVYIDNVSLGSIPPKDIQAQSIDISNSPISTITPKATFKNAGSVAQTFNVTLTTTGYSSTKTVAALGVGLTQQVTFDNWAPATVGTYQFTAYSSLAADAAPANDTVRKSVTIASPLPNSGWRTATALTTARFGHASTSYKGPLSADPTYLYVMGGSTGTATTTTVAQLNTTTGVWATLTPLTTGRTNAQAYQYNGKIYYMGGYASSFTPTTEVSVYDIAANTWATGAAMPTAVGDYAGVQYHDSLIYVIAGYAGSTLGDVTLVQVYNAKTNTWSSGTAYPGTAAAGLRAGVANDKIVIVGGYSQTLATTLAKAWVGTISPLAPTNITWTAINDYPGGTTSRTSATGIKGSNYVYFTGGDATGAGTSGMNDTWAYDVVGNQWLFAPVKTTGVSNLVNFVPLIINDSVYLAATGGYTGAAVSTVNEWLNLGKTSNVLPIKLLEFTANLQNDKTQLLWRATEDVTSGYYIIQKSKNSIDFEDIKRIEAGKQNQEATYTSPDLLPYKGYTYYRLKMVNTDGSISYSPIRSVFSNKANNIGLVVSLYPNPAKGQVTVDLQSNTGTPVKVNVRIVDVLGKIIKSEAVNLDGSLLKNYSLQPGSYFIYLSTDDNSFNRTEKIIVL